MKKILCSVFAVLALYSAVMAQDENDSRKKYKFLKSKSVNKTYTVGSGDKLNISNSFGSVEVHTWNKNEIKVDVAIEASSNKEDVAQRILDGISISEKQSGGEVSFKTSINSNNSGKNEKSNMSINYSIYMPETNQLNLKNEFGTTIIPDFKGKVDLTSKFGSLKTGALPGNKSIVVEFGSAEFESISNGAVTIKYSKATVGKLSGDVDLNVEFSSNIKINLDNTLTALDAKISYSTINLKPVAALPAAYSITTSFGSFKNKTGIQFTSDESDEEKEPKFDYKYEGKNAGGSVPVKLKTSFSKIILGEASAEDMEKKEKNKSKKKTA